MMATLVGLLIDANEETLAEIDQQLFEKKAARAKVTEELDRQIEALESLRKAVDLKLNGKPERKPRQPKPLKLDGLGGTPVAQRSVNATAKDRIIALLKSKGAMSAKQIANELGVSDAYVYSLVRDSAFTRTSDGYDLASIG